MTSSLSIDRTSLSKSPLVADEAMPTGTGLWIPQAGIGRIGVARADIYATAPDYHGETITRSRKTNASWPWVLYAAGTTTADVETLLDDLEEAVDQLTYDVTWTVDGVGKVVSCFPASVDYSGAYETGYVVGFVRTVSVTVPTLPIPTAV